MAIKFLNTATGITEAAGDNSTKIATTAYVDAAAGAVPIGDYLPLAGGTLTGPLTGTSATFGGNVIIATSGAVNNLLITSTDTTTAGAPDIVLYADAPAVTGDTMGDVLFQGKNGMVPSSTSPLTYTGLFSKMVDKDNNHSSLVITTHKGNGSGAQALTATLSAKGVNNSATGTLLINPSSVTDVADYNLEVKGDALIQDDFYVNGNVGIGTDIPNEKLDVRGKVYIESQGVDWNETTPGKSRGALHFDPVGSGTDHTGNAITFGASDSSAGTNANSGIYTRSDGTYGTKMYFATTDSYALGSKTRMMIDYNGNVGIGTTSPTAKLQVKKAIAGNETLLGIEATGAGTTVLGSITYDQSADTMRLLNNSTFADTSLRLGTQGNDNLVIDSAGNVGIGTTSPGVKLDVSGTIKTNAIFRGDTLNNNANTHNIIYRSGTTTFIAGGDKLVVEDGGNVGIGTSSPTTSYSKALQIHASGNGSTLRLTDSVSSSSIGSGLELLQYGIDSYIINRESGPMYFLTSSTTQMTILANGNVGIGLTDPDSRLDINAGVSNVVNGPAVRISKGASPIGLIRYDTVVIEANDVATIRIGESDGTVSTIMSGDNNLRINSTDPIKFYTAGTPGGEGHAGQGGTFAMIIDNSQNVGIGTASPGEKLQVAGDMFLSNSSSRIAIGENITGTPYKGYADGKNGPGQLVVAGYASSSQFPGVMTLMNRDSSISANQDLGVIQFVGKDDGSSGYCSSQIIGTSASAPGSGNTGGGTLRFLTNPGGTGANIEERLRIASNGNVGIGDTSPSAKLSVNGGVQVANDTSTASAANVGTIRYRVSGNNSYVDMCMQNGATTYAWVNIVQNNW